MAGPLALSDTDIDALNLKTANVLAAVEQGLMAEASGTAISEATVSFRPMAEDQGLLSVVRGSLPAEDLALIKAVGTYPDNPVRALPANPGLAILLNAKTGMPRAILNAARLTTLRTAAVTAIAAKVAARPDSAILGCIGSRGIAAQAARYIAELFPLREIRVHSRDPERREQAAHRLTEETGVPAVPCADWRTCLAGADIMLEGASLTAHASLFPQEAIRPGSTVIAYGAYSSMPAEIVTQFDGIVMDRWVEGDRGESGALGPSVAAGRLKKSDVQALLGDIIAGSKVVRTNDRERLLVWHRGVAACDIALAKLLLEAAAAKGLGQTFQI